MFFTHIECLFVEHGLFLYVALLKAKYTAPASNPISPARPKEHAMRTHWQTNVMRMAVSLTWASMRSHLKDMEQPGHLVVPDGSEDMPSIKMLVIHSSDSGDAWPSEDEETSSQEALDNKGSAKDNHLLRKIDPAKLFGAEMRSKVAKVAQSQSKALDPTQHWKGQRAEGCDHARVPQVASSGARGSSELPDYCGKPPTPMQQSWTIGKASPETASIEVNHGRKHFYLKGGPANLKTHRHISWAKYGGIDKAWEVAQGRKTGWTKAAEKGKKAAIEKGKKQAAIKKGKK